MPSKPSLVKILMVEDNPGDARLTTEALKEAKIANELVIIPDGAAAVEWLRENATAGSGRPDLVLLDLNLPGMHGTEVLAHIKADPDLRDIPVVILTSSKADTDVITSYQLHANCYVTKPVDFDRFAEVVRSIERFWFGIVELPPRVAK